MRRFLLHINTFQNLNPRVKKICKEGASHIAHRTADKYRTLDIHAHADNPALRQSSRDNTLDDDDNGNGRARERGHCGHCKAACMRLLAKRRRLEALLLCRTYLLRVAAPVLRAR